jgi:integrase
MPKLSPRKPVRTYDDLEKYRVTLDDGVSVKDHNVPNLSYQKQGDRMFARFRIKGKGMPRFNKSWPMPLLADLRAQAVAEGKASPNARGCVAAEEYLEKVRAEARQLRTRVKLGLASAQPELPIQVKTRTLADLIAHYRRVSEGHLKPSTFRDIGNYLKRDELKPLLGRELTSITLADMLKLHTTLGKRGPTLANRMIDHLRAIFEHGVKLGWLSVNPAKGVKRFKEEPRTKFLTPQQLDRLIEELNRDPHPRSVNSRNAVLLLALSGQRKGEVLGAKWKEFDLEARTWTKPASRMKAGKEHIFPLEGPVLELLKDMEAKANPKPDDYLFPGEVPGKPLRDIKRYWDGVTKRAGLEGFTPHDLRKTFGSLLAMEPGSNIYFISKLLGHGSLKTTVRHYAHLQTDALRDAAGAFGARFAKRASQ